LNFKEKKKKRVLVCPLNWGLGHATRCIPVIRQLIDSGAEVIIGADKGPYDLLKKEFPELEVLKFPGYVPSYPEKFFVLKTMLSIPVVLFHVYKEHQELKQIVKNYNIDAVISDNRFGCWHKGVPSVFITHQLRVKAPLGEGLLFRLNKWFIGHYGSCWVPDNEGEPNLSGELSHISGTPKNVIFIGPLSRFHYSINKPEEPFKYKFTAIISGPEPQRSHFEKIMIREFRHQDGKTVIVRGIPGNSDSRKTEGNIKIHNHLSQKEMESLINSSEIIISRPGYTSLMDLAALGKKAFFVPTPGQTEQEYLAKELRKKQGAQYAQQKDFTLSSIKNEGLKPLEIQFGNEKLKAAITVLLSR
jgi:UDP:flavonoid glycosyltransferase YjiC (YdhE family)